jgi:hypothetical protein
MPNSESLVANVGSPLCSGNPDHPRFDPAHPPIDERDYPDQNELADDGEAGASTRARDGDA